MNIKSSETGKELEDELASEVSGDIKNLLISQSNAGRDEEGSIDYDKLDNDVDKIVEVGHITPQCIFARFI